MVTSVRQMLETANAAVPKITPDQASDMIKKGNTLVVDVRDAPEVSASGKIAGAVNVSRGMLEFRADPDSPYHDKNFDKERPLSSIALPAVVLRSPGRSSRIWVTTRSIMSADLKIGPARSKRSKNRRITVRYDLSSIGTATRWRAGTPPCLEQRPPNRYYAAWIGPTIYETKPLCIGNLPSKPTILSSRTVS
jgi:rhodanese-related sulfurtransferase